MGSQILRVLFSTQGSTEVTESKSNRWIHCSVVVQILHHGLDKTTTFDLDLDRRVENEARFFPSLSPLSLRRLLYEYR